MSSLSKDMKERATEAIRLAVKHLGHSQDVTCQNAVYHTPANQLRIVADELEQKDRDIAFIREVLKEIEGGEG